VAIDREEPESYESLLADPAATLKDWLSDPRYTDAYVLITRSQKIAVHSEQSMPEGSLDQIETALRHAPDFRVLYDSGDGVVFALTEPKGTR
jgi:hypothetical protein